MITLTIVLIFLPLYALFLWLLVQVLDWMEYRPDEDEHEAPRVFSDVTLGTDGNYTMK